MIERWESEDPYDARLARGATGALRVFNEARVLTSADVHVAARAAELVGEPGEEVRLALALTVRAARHGSVCVDLAGLMAEEPGLPWPPGLSGEDWLGLVSASPLAARGVVRVDGGLLYLDRYHREEAQVCADLLGRLALPPAGVGDAGVVAASAARLFPGEGFAEQRESALAALGQSTTVLTGGPGTGKTTTVAGLLALLTEASPVPLRIALAAPTGKAAARL